jgi:hypothetical protein
MSAMVGALVAGGLAPACTAEGVDAGGGSAETESTQSALTLNANLAVVKPVKIATLPPPPSLPTRIVCGKTVRITSADLDFALRALLFGTRIVYDTTGKSDTLVGPYYHCTYPNDEALQAAIDECLAGPAQSKGACLEQAHEDYPQTQECVSTSAAYHSYIDFGAAAEDRGAKDMFFDSDTIRRVNWAGTFDFDINFVRTTIDQNTIAGNFTKDPASDKAIANISLKMSSNDPTVHCRGGLPCPDVNLSNMKVLAQLTGIAPTADRTQLGFDMPEVTFSFDKNINNLPDWFIDLFKDVDGLIRNRVEKRLESALEKDGTRAAFNRALSELAEFFANQKISTFYAAWFDGGDLVVDYEPLTRQSAPVSACLTKSVILAP